MQIDLTPLELVQLDGRCTPETQAIVDDARLALTFGSPDLAALVIDARASARKLSAIRWSPTSISYCAICKRSDGYPLHARGRDRGFPDHGHPNLFAGVDLSANWIHVRQHASVGGCLECMTRAAPVLTLALADLVVELPDQLRAEGAPKRKRWERRRCECCGWEGHEGEMRMKWSPGGRYPGQCPACPNENTGKIPRLSAYSVVEVSE